MTDSPDTSIVRLFNANDKVRALETMEGGYGAKIIKGQTYTVDTNQHPKFQTIWIVGHGRWLASRFELIT